MSWEETVDGPVWVPSYYFREAPLCDHKQGVKYITASEMIRNEITGMSPDIRARRALCQGCEKPLSEEEVKKMFR